MACSNAHLCDPRALFDVCRRNGIGAYQPGVFWGRRSQDRCLWSVINIANHKSLNHRLEVTGGIFSAECAALISEFFQKKRKLKQAID